MIIGKKDLREQSGISTTSLAKLGKGENITTDVLLKICEALNCNINEIMRVSRNPETRKKYSTQTLWTSSRGLIQSVKQ